MLHIYPFIGIERSVFGLKCGVCSNRVFLHGWFVPRVEAMSVHRHIGPSSTSPLYSFFLRHPDLLMTVGERRWPCEHASMEMHVLPFVVPLVPHAALLALVGMRYALFVHVLCQSDVRDARGVLAQQVHVGVQDRRVYGFAVLRQNCIIKVKFVEIHSLD